MLGLSLVLFRILQRYSLDSQSFFLVVCLYELGSILGVPTCVLLNSHASWKWGKCGSPTPGDPSVRYFRQSCFGDSISVMAQVDEALQARFQQGTF